jgi:hypothetical protein
MFTEPIQEERNMFELIVNQDLAQRRVQKQFGTEPARDRYAGERAKQAARHPTVAARALRVLASARSTAWAALAYRARRRATELR